MSTDQLSIDWYNQNAKEYTKHVRDPDDSVYHSLYEKPAMYNLLPNLKGKSVISLGCGSGEDCNYLKLQGANKVTGIDISKKLIDVAKNSYPDCKFSVMDMEHLTFEDNSFDFAYSSLAIHYIEDWTNVMSEVYRVLKPGGYFLFSCNHPVYSALELVKDNDDSKDHVFSRSKNRKTNKVSIVGDYVKRKALIPKSPEVALAVTTWHKSIGEISQEATLARFLIANICEPKPLTKMQEIAPNDYNTLLKMPYFIIFKLLKIK